MSFLRIRADSTEYATATITTDHDITGKGISVALPPVGQPPATWQPATVLGVVADAGKWTATFRILLGPVGGAFALAAGDYDWTVRVSDTPEVPVLRSGHVHVVEV